MRVIVTGDRAWYDPELAEQVISRLMLRHGPNIVIVHDRLLGLMAARSQTKIPSRGWGPLKFLVRRSSTLTE